MNRLAAMWAKEETRIAARGSAEVRADEARRAKRVASEAAEAAAKKNETPTWNHFFPEPRTKHQPGTIFFRSQERNTDLEPFFSEAKNETPTWNYFFPGFLNWK